jgi:hypothetical protein
VVVYRANLEYKERWRLGAFVGWQRYCREPRGEGSAPMMDLSEYFNMFGLGDEPEQTNEEVLEAGKAFLTMLGVSL